MAITGARRVIEACTGLKDSMPTTLIWHSLWVVRQRRWPRSSSSYSMLWRRTPVYSTSSAAQPRVDRISMGQQSSSLSRQEVPLSHRKTHPPRSTHSQRQVLISPKIDSTSHPTFTALSRSSTTTSKLRQQARPTRIKASALARAKRSSRRTNCCFRPLWALRRLLQPRLLTQITKLTPQLATLAASKATTRRQ